MKQMFHSTKTCSSDSWCEHFLKQLFMSVIPNLSMIQKMMFVLYKCLEIKLVKFFYELPERIFHLSVRASALELFRNQKPYFCFFLGSVKISLIPPILCNF